MNCATERTKITIKEYLLESFSIFNKTVEIKNLNDLFINNNTKCKYKDIQKYKMSSLKNLSKPSCMELFI